MSFITCRLSEVTELITKGTTPTTLGFELVDTGIPFLRAQNLQDGRVDVGVDPLYISPQTHKALARSKIFSGDILLSIAGTIGRVALVGDGLPEMNCNQAVAIVRPNSGVCPKYLLYWLSSSAAMDQIRKSKVTATISNLSLSQIGNMSINLPPLDEQRRIAAILNQADDLRGMRRETLRRLETLGQAFFSSNFIFSELLRVPLTNLADIMTGLVDPTQDQYINLPHIAPDNIESHSGELLEYRTAGEDGVFSGKYLFDEGSVLYSKIRPYLNKVALSPGKGVCSADMYVLHPIVGASTREYLWFLLRSPDFLKFAEKYSGRLSIPKLNRDQLTSYQAPSPSFDRQLKFSEFVGELMGARAHHQMHFAKLDALFASLQHRAFRVEL